MRYSDKTIDYFEQTRHAGVLVGLDVIVGEAVSSSSHESLRFFVQFENEKIMKCHFQANASVATIASAEFVAEWCENKMVAEVLELKAEKIIEILELPSLKIHSVLLVMSALNNAIDKRKL